MSRRPPGGVGREDQLLAALSHELRTPLNGVLGMAGLLARTRLDAAQRTYLTALQESGEHLLGLVNDVLDLAKLDSGGFDLNPAPMDVEELLQSVAELLSPRAHAKGLEIAWAADPDLPVISADEGRLRQILLNLAGNAVKFTETGGVLLAAHQVQVRSGVGVRFSVKDTGPGVAEADRERIFEPFASSSALQHAIESTGLGLAIVRRLAAAFSGEIGLDSEPGLGSDFWFEAAFPEVKPALPHPSLEGLTIAVAAANGVVAEAAARQIEACGGVPLLFSTPAEAKHAPAGAPVLIDYALQSGRRPRPLPGRPTIVMLRPEQRGRITPLRRMGFAGYLIKPLRRRSLAVRVQAVTEQAARPHSFIEDERAQPSAAPGARVLLAEDNPINAMLARALLQREGCTVERVTTGPQAVEAALAYKYDLILLDLRMPELGGLEAAAILRSKGVTTPIAALTADAMEDSRRACFKAGMDDFLTKPLDPDALRALLARHIGAGFTQDRPGAKLAS